MPTHDPIQAITQLRLQYFTYGCPSTRHSQPAPGSDSLPGLPQSWTSFSLLSGFNRNTFLWMFLLSFWGFDSLWQRNFLIQLGASTLSQVHLSRRTFSSAWAPTLWARLPLVTFAHFIQTLAPRHSTWVRDHWDSYTDFLQKPLRLLFTHFSTLC